ncbi:hypothetical protein [Tolypothrix sp. VBCCA 56010]|uniref:hypothetical protein n=1 Tax=Tolypothrix sp. VBCCA 56010 TaxID=3137731 RepID=UPI003D7ED669
MINGLENFSSSIILVAKIGDRLTTNRLRKPQKYTHSTYMKKYRKFVKRLLLLATPMVASSVLASTPSQAASLALSKSEVKFTDFNQSLSAEPIVISNTDTFTNANKGTVDAKANAEATFYNTPKPSASNFAFSQGSGKGEKYFGIAKSFAQVIADFAIEANQSFSFNFTSDLNLLTAIDNPQLENAIATGTTSFALFDIDNHSVVDYFSVVGNLNTAANGDSLELQNTDNISFSRQSQEKIFGGNEELANAYFEGYYQRTFTDKINLRLIEFKANQASVATVPEASNVASFLVAGLIGVALKRKNIAFGRVRRK